MPRENIRRWILGDSADLETVRIVLQKMGGDINRALPGAAPGPSGSTLTEDLEPYGSHPVRLPVLGQVAAGGVEMEGRAEDTIQADPRTFEASPYFRLTTGVAGFLQICGDSMHPDYRDGELIAVGQPRDPASLPNGAPCVFHARGRGTTFKILHRDRHTPGLIMGCPLNHRHEPIIFQADQVDIQFIALGRLDIGRTTPAAKLERAFSRDLLKRGELRTKKKG